MKVSIRVLSALILLLLMVSSAHAIGMEAAIGGWGQDVGGDLAYKSTLPIDSFDFDEDARYDDEDRVFGRLKLDLPIVPNLYFLGTPMEFEGNGNKNFDFGDVTISGDFYSKASLDHYDLALYYGIPLTGAASLGTLGVDLGINVRRLQVEVMVRETSVTGAEDSVDETFYIPMGYLAVQFKPTKKLSLEGEFRGIAYSDNHYYDVIARLKYRFAGPLFAAAGWRYEDMEVDEKDVRVDAKVDGPFAEVGLQF